MPFIDRSPLNYIPGSPSPIRRWQDSRAPTAADFKQFKIGDMWNDKASQDWYILCYKNTTAGIWRKMAGTAAAVETFTPDTGGVVPSDVANNLNLLGNSGSYTNGMLFIGDSVNNTISARDLRNTTKYVVDPTANETEYTTIQSAIDAAHAAGGGMIWIRSGSYIEDLIFYDNIQISSPSEQSVTIIGIHTPPSSGALNIDRITFQSTTHIFSSTDAGNAAIIMEDCSVEVTNGYTFYLPNWTSGGSVAVFNIGNFGTEDGFFYNVGGSQFYAFAAGIGNGTSNPLTLSGIAVLANQIIIGCPIACVTGANISSYGSAYTQTIVTSNNAIFNSIGDSFSTGVSQAITHNSTNTFILSNATVDSTNNPAIGGTGSITLTGVNFVNDSNYAGTLTVTGGKTISGSARLLDRTDNAIAVYGTDGEVSELGPLTDGQLVIGSSGSAAVAGSLSSADGTVTITPGAGTIDLSAALANVDQDHIFYVGKHGNDANSGLNIEEAKLTFTAAIAAAVALVPSSTNRFSIVCLDDGIYTESFTISSYIDVDAPNASVTGNLIIQDNSSINLNYLTSTSGTDAIAKNTGSGMAIVHINYINAASTTNGMTVASGTVHFMFSKLTNVVGYAINLTSGGSIAVEGGDIQVNAPGRCISAVTGLNECRGCIQSITALTGGTGIYIASGKVFVEICDIAATTAYNISGGGANLSLCAASITGSTTIGAGTTVQISKNQTGYDTNSTFLIRNPQTSTDHFSITSAGVTTFPAGTVSCTGDDFDVTRAEIGSGVVATVSNTDNTNASSNAVIDVITGGASGGDPFFHLNNGVIEYSFGIDNSDSDILKLTDGASPSAGNDIFTLEGFEAPAVLSVKSLSVGGDLVGDTVDLVAANKSFVSGYARVQAIINNTASDPHHTAVIVGVFDWIWGQDHTDNSFKLGHGGPPSAMAQTFVTVSSGGSFNSTYDMRVGAATPTDTSSQISNEFSNDAAAVSIANRNNSNTAGSDAVIATAVAGTSAGDPFYSLSIAGVSNNMVFGLRNSDSDSFYLCQGTNLSGTLLTKVTQAGEMTKPLQPCFLAYNSADDLNQTGNGTVVTVPFDTELVDQNADFASNTFTAPVTGNYEFKASVMMSNLNAATSSILTLVTTAGSFILGKSNPTACAAGGEFVLSGSITVPMSATNTAYITLANSGAGADNNTINGSASPYETWFSGSLLC